MTNWQIIGCSKKIPSKNRLDKGFTLIELMVVIAIAGILVSLATPSFTNMTKNSRMRSEANALLGAFAYTRTEAVKRGNTVRIGTQGANGGLVAWVDQTGGTANSWDAGEELRLWEPIHNSMTINSGGSNSSFAFNGSGLVNTADVLTICDDRTGETGRTITLLVSGLTYISDVTCP
ncbi:MAG: GspH/FimT family pseudopilin [Pseudomonadales bacterium]|nr:GspH/FimT family pseudopilin [Pseudomonadales bacterium]